MKMTNNNNKEKIKVIESNLMSIIWKFQTELYTQGAGILSSKDIEIIDKHWKLLKLVTEHTFDMINEDPFLKQEKVGNI